MILEFFFFTFPKKWVGRAMGNETFYGDGLSRHILPVACPEDVVFKKESLDDNHKNKREDEDGSK